MGYPLKFELTREVIVCETSLLAKLHDETTGIRHLPTKRENTAATVMGRPDYRIQDSYGSLGC